MIDKPRDVIVLGSLSVLSAWGFDLLRFLFSISDAPFTVYNVDRNGPIPTPAVEGTRTAVISHFPTKNLLDRAAMPTSRVIVFLDDPVDSVRYVQDASDCTVLDAIRLQAAAVAGYVSIRGLPSLCILHRYLKTPRQVLQFVLNHFELTIEEDTVETLAAQFWGPEGVTGSLESALKNYVPLYAPLNSLTNLLTPEDNSLVAETLTPMLRMMFANADETLVWSRRVFQSGDSLHGVAPLSIDLTGGARVLYYGPCFHIPAGHWSARMLVGFNKGAVKMPFSAEVNSDEKLAHIIMVPEEKGVFLASFDFENHNALHPIEIRIKVDRGAISGHIAFSRVELWLGELPPPSSGISSFLKRKEST